MVTLGCTWRCASVIRALAEHALAAIGDGFSQGLLYFSPTFLKACVARAFGDDPTAQKAFTAARSEFERAVREQPDDGEPLCMLGLIDAGLGRKRKPTARDAVPPN